jgi:hypothetical protein
VYGRLRVPKKVDSSRNDVGAVADDGAKQVRNGVGFHQDVGIDKDEHVAARSGSPISKRVKFAGHGCWNPPQDRIIDGRIGMDRRFARRDDDNFNGPVKCMGGAKDGGQCRGQRCFFVAGWHQDADWPASKVLRCRHSG